MQMQVLALMMMMRVLVAEHRVGDASIVHSLFLFGVSMPKGEKE
jgi:hypothetical protein